VNISAESKPDFMSGFFSLEMLVSAYFATIKSKRLEALQSIFSKACRVVATMSFNRLQGPFPRALAAPMRTNHPCAFALRSKRSRIARIADPYSIPSCSPSRIVLIGPSPDFSLRLTHPHTPVAKNMQKPGNGNETFQRFFFD
jgi:hypothetical protein